MEIEYTSTDSRIDQCAAACKHDGFTYYAMDSGTHCWCAQSEPDAVHLSNVLCSPCADDATKSCGNVNYGFMSVYKISPSKLALPRLDGVHTFGSRYVSTVLSTDVNHVDKHVLAAKEAELKKKLKDDAKSSDDDDDDDEDDSHSKLRHLRRLRRHRLLRHLHRLHRHVRREHESEEEEHEKKHHHEKEDD